MPKMTLDEALKRGIAHQDAGRLEQAESIYQQILHQQPAHGPTLRMMGLVLFQAGRAGEALDFLRRAIAADPAASDYHGNLGVVLASLKRWDESIAALRQALLLSPVDAASMTNLANVLQESGRLDESIVIYRETLSLRSDIPETHYNFGRALHEKRLFDRAIEQYRAAIALRPNYAEAFNNLGNALNDLANTLEEKGNVSEAVAAYREALAIRPDFPEAYNNLGNVLLETSKLDEAIECYRRALSLKGDYAEAYNNLGNAFKESGQLEEALENYRKAALLSDESRVAGNLLYVMHFSPQYGPREIYEAHAQWNQRFAKPLAASIAPHQNQRTPDRRLRIGYVSPDFREHPVGRFMLPLMGQHDHRQFEIFCYTDVRLEDSITKKLRAGADAWRVTIGQSDEQLAELIRSDRIDILVDLTMHLKGSRLLVFARKPAPVQVTYLAYCSTTGLETIDYRLSDRYLDPEDSDLSLYSEKTFRLPRTYWCYPQPDESPEPQIPSSSSITFGCLNNYSKVTTKIFDIWCDLLHQLPGSRLVLHSHEGSHRQLAWDRMKSHGLDPQRLAFNAFAQLGRYLGQYHQIDIALDPFPYGGGTTTCDALWMGVPVVSLRGTTCVSRGGSSILSNIAHPEWVASNESEYVRIAMDLANDANRLRELRSTLQDQLRASPLMDAPQFARDIEAAYRQMWRDYCWSSTG